MVAELVAVCDSVDANVDVAEDVPDVEADADCDDVAVEVNDDVSVWEALDVPVVEPVAEADVVTE